MRFFYSNLQVLSSVASNSSDEDEEKAALFFFHWSEGRKMTPLFATEFSSLSLSDNLVAEDLYIYLINPMYGGRLAEVYLLHDYHQFSLMSVRP
jgi:hypothetical protein